ncbi:hypothetical protein B0H14DRAFT_2588946 [Mycena olivaceomarginata]|nr:hypothetical protein B0H14DRAFT_2588946 [Mycena olivaceomarginata]
MHSAGLALWLTSRRSRERLTFSLVFARTHIVADAGIRIAPDVLDEVLLLRLVTRLALRFAVVGQTGNESNCCCSQFVDVTMPSLPLSVVERSMSSSRKPAPTKVPGPLTPTLKSLMGLEPGCEEVRKSQDVREPSLGTKLVRDYLDNQPSPPAKLGVVVHSGGQPWSEGN